MTKQTLNPFLRAYLVAAFWTLDDDAPSGDYEQSGRPEIMFSDLSPEAIEMARRDCALFEDQNREFLSQAGDDEQNGHDFWLTRNGHGAGFWDRGYDDAVGDGLTNSCRSFGGSDLYRGDDGKLYFSR